MEIVSTEPHDESTGHEGVAAEVASTVGDAVKDAHGEALTTLRGIVDTQAERIRCLEEKLEQSISTREQHVQRDADRAAEVVQTVAVAHAVEEAAHAEHDAIDDVEPVADPVAGTVTEVEDDTKELAEEAEGEKPAPKRKHRLYGKRG